MELKIIKADKSDVHFVYECLQYLIDKKLYTYEQFFNYYHSLLQLPDKPHLWIAQYNNEPIGFISAVKFYMNRYLGYGIELEEIVIHSNFQGKGLGTEFIRKLIEFYGKDEACRKVLIKSNDHKGSCRLYERIIDKTDFIVFSKRLNNFKMSE